MNSIWNNNLAAFKKRFPQLAQIINAPADGVDPAKIWELICAKSGEITAVENGIRLHSAYNPVREANTAVSQNEVSEKSATVFYGFGLGYHVIEWAKRYTNRKLILIEPDAYYFLASLSVLDWSSVFKLENLIIAVGCPPESVLQLLEDGSTVNVENSGVSDAYYFDIPAFQNHAKPYFDAVKSLIKRNQRKNEINAATLKKFGKLWCRNSKKNLPQLLYCSPINVLENKAYDFVKKTPLPFFIVGAGPSLEKVLPIIAEIKKRTIIVCVETALRALLRAGVQPDFIILTDPQFWAYRHIAGLMAPDSVLISEVSAYPSVFRFLCKKIMLCGSQFPIGQWFENKFNLNIGDLGTGGSVASAAWNFAHYCGADTIYTAGLDFSFPGKQTHIKGSSAEQTYHTVSNRLSTIDKFTAATIFSANAIMAKDYNGNPVITDSRMKMFSWWFEARLAACPQTKTYTICPEGLQTPGITPSTVEEILKLPEITDQKKEFIQLCMTCESVLDTKKEALLKKELNQFPNQDFLEKYSFLKEYL